MLKALLAALVLMAACAAALSQSIIRLEGSEWQFFTLLSDYNRRKVTRLGPQRYKVWVRIRLDRQNLSQERQELIDQRRRKGLPIDGYSRYSYNLSLYEVDCGQERIKVLRSVDYDQGDNVLETTDLEDGSQWEDTIPNSQGDSLVTVFCAEMAVVKSRERLGTRQAHRP